MAPPQAADGVVFRNSLLLDPAAELRGPLRRLPGGGFRLDEGLTPAAGLPAVTGGEFSLQGGLFGLQGLHSAPGRDQLRLQGLQLLQLTLRLLELRLQGGKLAGFVVAAAVQLLF